MSRAERRRAWRASRSNDVNVAIAKAVGTVLPSEMRPDGRYLELSLRSMTIGDMLPGYAYQPGTSLLRISVPPTAAHTGFIYEVPLHLPEEYRAATPANAQFAFLIATARDPEVAQVVAQMKQLARPRREVDAVRGQPVEVVPFLPQFSRGSQ